MESLPNEKLDLEQSALIRDETRLVKTNLTAQAVKDKMRLQVDDFDREVEMNIVFEEVNESSVGFKDVYDGFIGIAPWQ